VETFQEGEKPQGEIIALPLHETDLLVGDADVGETIELFPQLLSEAFGINSVVSVNKSVLTYSTWKFL
jgi:hypothetical protein